MRSVVAERPSRTVVGICGTLTIGSWLTIVGIVFGLDPEPTAHQIGFFLVLVVALWSTATLVTYALSFRLFSSKRHRGNVQRAVLHGVVTSFILTAAMLLQLGRALSLLNGALLGGAFLILQLVVLLRR